MSVTIDALGYNFMRSPENIACRPCLMPSYRCEHLLRHCFRMGCGTCAGRGPRGATCPGAHSATPALRRIGLTTARRFTNDQGCGRLPYAGWSRLRWLHLSLQRGCPEQRQRHYTNLSPHRVIETSYMIS